MNLRARTCREFLNDGMGRALSRDQIGALIEAADSIGEHEGHVFGVNAAMAHVVVGPVDDGDRGESSAEMPIA